MENQEYILQGWHIIMFIILFLTGIVVGVNLLKPRFDNALKELEKEEYEKTKNEKVSFDDNQKNS